MAKLFETLDGALRAKDDKRAAQHAADDVRDGIGEERPAEAIGHQIQPAHLKRSVPANGR